MHADTEWMLEEIRQAQTIERLIWLGEVIKFDADHGSEYALGDNCKILRKAWGDKKHQLKKEDK
jgi:hypothetical protein